jgi:hypothetical protein
MFWPGQTLSDGGSQVKVKFAFLYSSSWMLAFLVNASKRLVSSSPLEAGSSTLLALAMAWAMMTDCWGGAGEPDDATSAWEASSDGQGQQALTAKRCGRVDDGSK